MRSKLKHKKRKMRLEKRKRASTVSSKTVSDSAGGGGGMPLVRGKNKGEWVMGATDQKARWLVIKGDLY